MTETQEVSQNTGQHYWTHVLTEFNSLEDLSIPLRGSARLRYTCMCVSRRYIALGANTGAVYIFGRESLKHLQVVLAEKDSSPVSQVCFGPIDNLLGYACSNGNIIVVELNIERRSKPERVRLSVEHSGTTVTALQWDAVGGRLFAGDNLGKISVAFIPVSKAKDLFQHPSEGIVRLDSAIVQLDWSADRLLGWSVWGLFLPWPRWTKPLVFTVPGLGQGIWEVDYHGTVLNTHQFKQLLAIPSFPVITFRSMELNLPDKLGSGKAQSVSFPKLHTVCDMYLFTWSQNGLYVLDPVAVKVITWTKYSANAIDVKCYKNEVYIFSEGTGQVQKLLLLPVSRCVATLIVKEYWSLAGQLCGYFKQLLVEAKSRRYLPRSVLNDLYQQLLAADMGELVDKVKVILSSIDSLPDSSGEEGVVGIVRLDSGIYQVNDGRRLDSDEESSHTPSGSQSLSRKSSTSSLHTMFSEHFINLPSKKTREFNSAELQHLAGSTLTEGSQKIMRSVSLTEQILMSTQGDQTSEDSMNNVDENMTVDNVSNGRNLADLPKYKSEGNRNEAGAVRSVDQTETSVNIDDLNQMDPRSPGVLTNNKAACDRVDPGSAEVLTNNKETSDQVDPRSPGVLTDNKAACDRVDPGSAEVLTNNKEASDQVDPRSPGVLTNNKAACDRVDPRSAEVLTNNKETSDEVDPRSPGVLTNNKAACDRADPRSAEVSTNNKDAADQVDPRSITVGNKKEVDSRFPGLLTNNHENKQASHEVDRKENFDHGDARSSGVVTDTKEMSDQEDSRSSGLLTHTSEEEKPAEVVQKREGSTSSLSSNELIMDQMCAVPAVPVALNVGRSESGKKSGRKKKASLPVILGPGEKAESKAISDLGPRASIQEAIMEVEKQESVSAEQAERTDKLNFDQTNAALPMMQYSSWAMRSSSPINSQESSPSHSPVVQSWNGSASPTNITGPRTALKSVKESLSSKFSSTKKNLIRTIREKKTMFVSRDSSPVGNVTTENMPNEQQQKFNGIAPGGTKVERSISPFVEDRSYDVAEELSPLYRATCKAQAQLKHADTLLQPCPILTVWLQQLHQTLQQLHKTQQKHRDAQAKARTEVEAKDGDVNRDSQNAEETTPDLSDALACDAEPKISGENCGRVDKDTDETSEVRLDEQVCNEKDEKVDGELDTDIPDSNQPVSHDVDVISDTLSSLQVKDPDSLSIDSGHPAVDGQSEDAGSDLEARLSTDQDDVSVTALDVLSASQIDHGIPASSCSSATSDSFAESPQPFQDQFKTSRENDANITLPKLNSEKPELIDVDWMKQCYVSDPFNAGLRFSEDIGYLANICFELGLHGRVSDYIQPQITPGLSTETTVNQDTLNASDGSQSGCPSTDQSTGQIREEEDDRQLALFLRNYYSYLDIPRIKKALNSSSHHGYQTWQALVDCFMEVVRGDSVSVKLSENNTVGGFDLLRSGVGCDPAAVVGHLPRLFTVSPNKTLEFCLEEVKYIQPLDILYVTRLLNKPTQKFFLPYMLAKHSAMTQPGDLAALCESVRVRQTWLRGLLADGDTFVLKRQDKKPLPGSHLYPWKHQSIIKSILDEFMATDAAQLLDLCQEYGYWLGSLKMLHHLAMKQKGLEIIVRLGDITLLAADEWSPVSLEEWQFVLDEMVSLTTGSVEKLDREQTDLTSRPAKAGWTPSLTWDSLGLLLAQSVGAEKAISLLQTLSLPPEALSLSFYQGMIVAALGARQKRSLLHNILEKTDAYLWAKKPTQMAPQLLYAVEEERKMVSAVREGKQTQVFKDMFTQLESQPDLVCHRFVEDPECHWGVRCDLNRACPCCGLQLSAQVSMSQPGIVIFHCGHGYHKFCHQERVCQVCAESLAKLSN
ncbi:uncharacterized protein LOC135467222 [Liolophura sinensis]|uniref:uncharacterized protein LOC135467222 n=1 Tax=Liolophura sinensis TaxID=3198878 RepID=UPI0031582EF3